ncbi:hypothetical protein [Actinophytocola sp.]|uniref:hypothetical protein n=1 Tax=Actinophytocola sp. TaxID=1872138 RepID=UPI002D42D724|nr:hypothetical protein [Actinophytocola sp.]HYQ69101.1 hypothetical protein [Actinophytocola sp.]
MQYNRVDKETPSDEHGLDCLICETGRCVTDIYIVNPDGYGTTEHTCDYEGCIQHVIATKHHGDADVLVEFSTAPLPVAEVAELPTAHPQVVAA